MEWLDEIIRSIVRSRSVLDRQAGASEKVVSELTNALISANAPAVPSPVLDPVLYHLRAVGYTLKHAHAVLDLMMAREQDNLTRLHERARPRHARAPVYSAPSANPYRRLSTTLEPNLTPADGVHMQSPIAGRPADLDQFLWGGDITVNTPHETPGSDHALAATLCVMAHREPNALRRMVGWDADANPWVTGRALLRFPGRDPFTTSAALPLAYVPATSSRQAVGLRTTARGRRDSEVGHEVAYGVNYIAKGFAACQSHDDFPYHLDPATTPLRERVHDAMTFLTGRRVNREDPALEIDDDALAAHLDTAEVVACSRPLTADEAGTHQLFAGEHAYAVTGASDGQVHVHHPVGHGASVPIAAFKELFPDLLVGPPPLAGGPADAPFTPTRLENLAAHLE